MYTTATKKLGIYIHIPFCRTKCAYCDFYSFIPKGEEIYERYTNALIKHMEAYREAARDRIPDTVYIGGGTPTALPTEQLIRIIKAVKRNFKLSKNTEFTVEVNPKTCDLKTFKRLRRAGVNRISIGLQSADAGELKSLTRSHSRADFEECFKDARAAKIKNISVDLMFGIPGQTVHSLLSSIDYLTRLHPDHISLYDLKIEEGTPYFRIRDRLPLPDDFLYRNHCVVGCKFILLEAPQPFNLRFQQNRFPSYAVFLYTDGNHHLQLGKIRGCLVAYIVSKRVEQYVFS